MKLIALFSFLVLSLSLIFLAKISIPKVIFAQENKITITTQGNVEVVFNWKKDQCEYYNVPDSFARAFRDSTGTVNLMLTSFENYRMVGPTLNTVAKNCEKIMTSHYNSDFNAAEYREYITSPYTLDGRTVYALVHNEWYSMLYNPSCTKGWINSITTVQATYPPLTFTHPNDYKIFVPTAWNPSYSCSDNIIYGGFTPSNIIKKDNYYYAFYQSEGDPSGVLKQGTCIMRTQNLSTGSSWEKYTDHGWDNSVGATCSPISKDQIQRMHGSVTYNTYLKSYIMVDSSPTEINIISYSLSQDLMHWSKPEKLMDAPFPNYAYPSLLDPSDTSMNFENTGQDPYVYFSRFNADDNLDRDLLRQRVHFQLQPSITSICTLKSVGDANCDGKVNTDDFNIWRGEFLHTQMTKSSDFNSDGVINTDDFNIWRSGFLNSSISH